MSTIPRKRPAETQEEAWVADEDRFVLQQAKKRAVLRVKSGRGRPIDKLAVALRAIDPSRNTFDDEFDGEEPAAVDPEAIFGSLNSSQLEELEKEIETYLTLEKNRSNHEYWQTMKLVCKDRRRETHDTQSGKSISSVAENLDKILGPKTLKELEALEKQIKKKLRSDEAIDVDYWESLLNRLSVHKARAQLRKVTQAIKDSRVKEEGAKSHAASTQVSHQGTSSTNGARRNGSANVAYDREVARGMGENEELFAAEEVATVSKRPAWADKHEPRKPRYHNRVQLGFEWNKYNQTHFDQDNPPPKVVQGYKFNIFYPDLIDVTKAPTYRIEREDGRKKGQILAPAGQDDTCVIRFIAGAPYEDIAFRIVDREWDYSAKYERGFKSSFDKGVLQLHFNFRKIFYRK